MILHAIFSYIDVYILAIFSSFFQKSSSALKLNDLFEIFQKNDVIII